MYGENILYSTINLHITLGCMTGATPHQEKGLYRGKELGEALGGGLEGKKGTKMPWVYLVGLGAKGFKASQVHPRHF